LRYVRKFGTMGKYAQINDNKTVQYAQREEEVQGWFYGITQDIVNKVPTTSEYCFSAWQYR